MMKIKFNNLKTLDKVLILLGAFLFVFIIASVIIYTVNGWPFDTLITMVLGGSGIELISTALITISKYRRGIDSNEAD